MTEIPTHLASPGAAEPGVYQALARMQSLLLPSAPLRGGLDTSPARRPAESVCWGSWLLGFLATLLGAALFHGGLSPRLRGQWRGRRAGQGVGGRPEACAQCSWPGRRRGHVLRARV